MAPTMGRMVRMMQPCPPFFVIEGYDLSVHTSLEHLLSFLEPIDVKENIYSVYDSEGKLLCLIPCGQTVKLDRVDGDPKYVYKFVNSLKEILIEIKDPMGGRNDWSLQDLVEYCKKFTVKY